jgi:hypothetical protein
MASGFKTKASRALPPTGWFGNLLVLFMFVKLHQPEFIGLLHSHNSSTSQN